MRRIVRIRVELLEVINLSNKKYYKIKSDRSNPIELNRIPFSITPHFIVHSIDELLENINQYIDDDDDEKL